MSQSKNTDKNKKFTDEEQSKWFVRDDLQDLAKFGGDILKKTVATGIDVIKEVKENFPKDANLLITKGKEELLKGLSQDVIKNMISFGLEKLFDVAGKHTIEVSICIKKKNQSEK
jgi:hypothetical protein